MPLDNGEKVGVIFMDLSKAFGVMNHKRMVFLTKLSLIQSSYLRNIFHRSIINGYFSSWNEIITGGS